MQRLLRSVSTLTFHFHRPLNDNRIPAQKIIFLGFVLFCFLHNSAVQAGSSGKSNRSGGSLRGSKCTEIRFVVYTEEFFTFYENSLGDGRRPTTLYDPKTMKPVGNYTDLFIVTDSNITAATDCVGTGAYSFGFNPDTYGYESQVNLAMTCGSNDNAIVGGTGKYGCASGYETYPYPPEGNLTTLTLHICGPLCPK